MTRFLQRLALRATGRVSPIRSVSEGGYFPPQLTVADAGGKSSGLAVFPESTPERMVADTDIMRNSGRAETPIWQSTMGQKGDALVGPPSDDAIPNQLKTAQVERVPDSVEDPKGRMSNAGQRYGDSADTGVRGDQQRQHTNQPPAELMEPEVSKSGKHPLVASVVKPESFALQNESSSGDHRQTEFESNLELPPLLPLQNEISEPENQPSKTRNALSEPVRQTVPASVEETTEVHVSIGRIDVTAVYESSQDQQEKKAQSQRPSPMSLDEYLARRHGRSS